MLDAVYFQLFRINWIKLDFDWIYSRMQYLKVSQAAGNFILHIAAAGIRLCVLVQSVCVRVCVCALLECSDANDSRFIRTQIQLQMLLIRYWYNKDGIS